MFARPKVSVLEVIEAGPATVGKRSRQCEMETTESSVTKERSPGKWVSFTGESRKKEPIWAIGPYSAELLHGVIESLRYPRFPITLARRPGTAISDVGSSNPASTQSAANASR